MPTPVDLSPGHFSHASEPVAPPPQGPQAPPPSSTAPASQAQMVRLSQLIHLIERSRLAPVEELRFIMANETLQVVPYQQAVYVDLIAPRVMAVSGAARLDRSAPYIRWLENMVKQVPQAEGIRLIDRTSMASGASWDSWMAPEALWVPLTDRLGTIGALVLARTDPWTEADARILTILAGAYAQAIAVSRMRRPKPRKTHRRIWMTSAALLCMGLSLLPVRTGVLAPAEVIPSNPAFIRAPFAGIIDTMSVSPNARIQAKQVVVRLDRQQLSSQYDVARKALSVAQTEYAEATQAGMSDPKARAQIGPLQSRIDEETAQMAYQGEMLQRADILAPIAGIAVFNDPSEWIGKPVEAGERIMLIAPPTSHRIEIEVPVADVSTFSPKADVLFFDDLAPDHPRRGQVVFSSYTSALTPAGVLAYTFRADLEGSNTPRLGIKGTAKIFGPTRPLLLWLLRKPLSSLRPWLAVW